MPRFFSAALISAFGLSAAACGQDAETAAPETAEAPAPAHGGHAMAEPSTPEETAAILAAIQTETITLITNDFSEVGTAVLRQGPTGVVIRIEAEGLPPGWHGAHLHEIGDCSSSDFTSSGGHINPDGRAHGLLHPDGPDAADMPNLYAHDDGVLRAEVFTPTVSLDGREGPAPLFDADGSALVIHANPDDQVSQPIGGAGPRIVCGVIGGAG